jgi:2-methylisocitrate lyase-like PEP mutase family enzyme
MNKQTCTHVRRFAALVFAVAGPLGSQAQTAPLASSDSEIVKLQEFVVTGSNLRRIAEETTLPVTVIDTDDLIAIGAATPANCLSI